MVAYKVMRLRKNGTLGSLFIRRRDVIPIGKWLTAEEYPTKGFAVRKGWHCTFTQNAPHLSMKDRVWVKVEVEDYTTYDRPESQGGQWILANKMKVLEIIE
jgi:hypothetical protein